MTTLSPAAQAVLDAYRKNWTDEPLKQDVKCMAAALRAAVDNVLTAQQILEIAAELDQSPSITPTID